MRTVLLQQSHKFLFFFNYLNFYKIVTPKIREINNWCLLIVSVTRNFLKTEKKVELRDMKTP